jgi:hypothetical protein
LETLRPEVFQDLEQGVLKRSLTPPPTQEEVEEIPAAHDRNALVGRPSDQPKEGVNFPFQTVSQVKVRDDPQAVCLHVNGGRSKHPDTALLGLDGPGPPRRGRGGEGHQAIRQSGSSDDSPGAGLWGLPS